MKKIIWQDQSIAFQGWHKPSADKYYYDYRVLVDMSAEVLIAIETEDFDLVDIT